jgi:hypothetical protein
VAALLRAHPGLAVEEVVLTTGGDRRAAQALPRWAGRACSSGDQGAAAGRIDLAVHA